MSTHYTFWIIVRLLMLCKILTFSMSCMTCTFFSAYDNCQLLFSVLVLPSVGITRLKHFLLWGYNLLHGNHHSCVLMVSSNWLPLHELYFVTFRSFTWWYIRWQWGEYTSFVQTLYLFICTLERFVYGARYVGYLHLYWGEGCRTICKDILMHFTTSYILHYA